MTTIAYRDGILVSDTRAYSGDKHPIGHKAKIHELEDGSLFGCSTTVVGLPERLLRWVKEGRDPDEFPYSGDNGFTVFLVDPEGQVFYAAGQPFFTGPLTASFWAIGSGEQYAHGALMAGASAEEAIRIACACDPWSAPPLQIITHRTARRAPRVKRASA